jgi:hypothetical protein
MTKNLRAHLVATTVVMLLLVCSAGAQTNDNFCWMQKFYRGMGQLPGSCASGSQADGALCYPNCAAGYTGVGPVCWQDCPSGFTDIGVSCQKPPAIDVSPYVSQSKCQEHNPGNSCYKDAALWYPYCPSGYSNAGPDVCSPNCPAGMTNAGADCTKQSYGRGAGTAFSCGSGMDTDDAGLCYPSCPAGNTGVGPECWTSCPANFPFTCGAACAVSEDACIGAVGNMVLSTSGALVDILSFAFGGPGVSDALKEATTAGEGAMADVLEHTAEEGESTLVNKAKAYAQAAAKQFVKSEWSNLQDSTNKFWFVMENFNTVSLKTLNGFTSDTGVTETTGVLNPRDVADLDPTGISSLILSFTQFGNCEAANDFTFAVTTGTPVTNSSGAVEGVALDPSQNGQGTVEITLTAVNQMTVTRVTTEGMSNCSIAPTADCIGQQLEPGQTCHITAQVNSGTNNLNGELDIYTNDYTSFPYPIEVVSQATPQGGPSCQAVPNIEEVVNLTSIAGTWALGDDQSQKLVVQVNGQFTSPAGNGTVSVYGLAGRAFQFTAPGLSTVLSLDQSNDHLTGTPNPGPITVQSSGLVLDTGGPGGSTLEQNSSNSGTSQFFVFVPQHDGTYNIQAGGLVLNALNGRGGANGTIYPATANGSVNQEFAIEPVGDESQGWYSIVSLLNGQYLTVANNATTAGTPIVLSNWVGSSNQEFQLSVPQRAVRRPTGAGCPNGETLFDSMCYDVAPGQGLDTPGIVGKLCPDDWRDDGTSCWPPWSGVAVASQADPNGSFTMRHPIDVTDCSSYDEDNGQSCPANFTFSAVCTCQAQPTLRNIKAISGTQPTPY